MPNTKNAIIRYLALDKCFRDFRHRYYIENLVDACSKAVYDFTGNDSVSRRTVLADIAFMESPEGWDIPLVRHKDGKRVFYRYESKDFSINNNDLTDDEITQLEVVISTLSRYRTLPSYEWIEETITNLKYRFGFNAPQENVIGFDHNERLTGIGFLPKVIDAATNHQTLSVSYRTFKGTAEDWIIYPYYVKQYNSRWFLFGWNKKYDAISNIPLDRIVRLQSLDLPFKENTNIDFDKYFDDIIGVTIPESDVPKTKIRLQFARDRFPYIVSKPIHHSQTILDEDKCIVEIDVIPNNELDTLLLSFGPQVIILFPQWYRDRVTDKIKENLKNYFPVQKGCTDEL